MTAVEPIIHVVDDDVSFGTAIARLLRASGYRVALYESPHQLLQTPLRAEPGCIILDIRMPGMTGCELQDRLVERENQLPVIFLTGYGNIQTCVHAIKSGAEDFLTKTTSKKTLLETIERALTRHSEKREQNERLASLRGLASTLTPRETEVFALVVRGKMIKQIAHELGTTERTAKAHRQAVMQKLNIHTIAEAVLIATRLGILN
jgi:FixJ family two-component response regulator